MKDRRWIEVDGRSTVVVEGVYRRWLLAEYDCGRGQTREDIASRLRRHGGPAR